MCVAERDETCIDYLFKKKKKISHFRDVPINHPTTITQMIITYVGNDNLIENHLRLTTLVVYKLYIRGGCVGGVV